jgi:hypothetical protein
LGLAHSCGALQFRFPNIAEGHASGRDGILARHLGIALGSAAEVDTLLELSVRTGLLQKQDVSGVQTQLGRTRQLTYGLRRRVRGKLVRRGRPSAALCSSCARGSRRCLGLDPFVRRSLLPFSCDRVRPLTARDFVLAWIHIVVFAHAVRRTKIPAKLSDLIGRLEYVFRSAVRGRRAATALIIRDSPPWIS